MQREVELLLEQINTVQNTTYLIAFFTHLRKILLHLLNICPLLIGQSANDLCKQGIVDTVGVFLGMLVFHALLFEHLILCVLESSDTHMVKRLFAEGVRINRHHLINIKIKCRSIAHIKLRDP